MLHKLIVYCTGLIINSIALCTLYKETNAVWLNLFGAIFFVILIITECKKIDKKIEDNLQD